MAACSSGSVIIGRSIRLSIGRLLRVLPDRLVFGLDLLQGRVCRQVNAKQAQAIKRAIDGLRIFALQYMQLDLQAGGVRELNVRSAALQQLYDQLLGFFEVTA